MRSLAIPILALFALIGAAPAFADVITDTISGTVTSGSDTANLFGGGDLTGDAISVTFSFNSGNPGSLYFDQSLSHPGITIQATMGGQTVTATDASYGAVHFQEGISGAGTAGDLEIDALDYSGFYGELLLNAAHELAGAGIQNQAAVDLALAGAVTRSLTLGSDVILIDTAAAPAPSPEPGTFGLGALVIVALFAATRAHVIARRS